MDFHVQKILVPIAFTENCERAKEFADGLASQFNAEVELLHVVEQSPYEVYMQRGIMENVPLYERAGTSMPSADQKFIIRDVLEETRNELERIAASNSKGVKHEVKVRHGHAVDEILHEIDEYRPSVVVMATHGRSGLQHMVLGSVTEKIVRLSPVPVLTLRLGE